VEQARESLTNSDDGDCPYILRRTFREQVKAVWRTLSNELCLLKETQSIPDLIVSVLFHCDMEPVFVSMKLLRQI
jgi:hypothetical protein